MFPLRLNDWRMNKRVRLPHRLQGVYYWVGLESEWHARKPGKGPKREPPDAETRRD
jgi:hypothetical protein